MAGHPDDDLSDETTIVTGATNGVATELAGVDGAKWLAGECANRVSREYGGSPPR